MNTGLLGGLGPLAFLQGYWQKQPLLVRRAFPDWDNPLAPDELAGLACEEGVEARIVLERGGAAPWELRRGPFPESAFAQLPRTHWTLLVQDVDKHVPELRRLIEPFRFIPDWRIDDLMVSYAVEGGSVGPHQDDYDVFLIQGLGQRRWRIADRPPAAADELVPDLPLRILRHFKADREWVLNPGDMLYLPPGVAHHGIASGPHCMTYSVGFRAPAWHELLSRWADYAGEQCQAEGRYRDPDLKPQENPGEITPETAQRIHDRLKQLLERPPDEFSRWLGAFLTEPKEHLGALPADAPVNGEQLSAWRLAGIGLAANPASGFAYTPRRDGGVWLFADGDTWPVAEALAPLARDLCRERRVEPQALGAWLDRGGAPLLCTLLDEGLLQADDG